MLQIKLKKSNLTDRSYNLVGIKQPKVTLKFDSERNIIARYSSLCQCAKLNDIPVASLYQAIKHNKELKGNYYGYAINNN